MAVPAYLKMQRKSKKDSAMATYSIGELSRGDLGRLNDLKEAALKPD
jgi:hypothetical protein